VAREGKREDGAQFFPTFTPMKLLAVERDLLPCAAPGHKLVVPNPT